MRKKGQNENLKVNGTARSAVRYELKASYEGNKRIYAVVDISADSTLDDLCGKILDAFDFTQEHLYLFNFNGRGYGRGSNVYYFMPDSGEKGTDIALGKLNLSLKQKFYLLYDFGDEWEFCIQVQKIYQAEGHVIDGIISVKGELEQYPEPDYEDFDDEWDFDDDFDDDYEEEELLHFQLSADITVRDILNTFDDEHLRVFAAGFLGPEKREDCLSKNVEWVREQYAKAVLQDRERLLLFMPGITGELFSCFMTSKVDPDNGFIEWTELLEDLLMENEDEMGILAEAVMHLYSLGICMPQENPDDGTPAVLICKEVRDVYEKWMKQSRNISKLQDYRDTEWAADILMYRYSVIEIDKLQKMCQEKTGCSMKKADFRWLISGRLEYFNRYAIYPGYGEGVEYLSVFPMEQTEMVLQARAKTPELTYRPYDVDELKKFSINGPYSDANAYMKLMETLWNSLQDSSAMKEVMCTFTEACIMEMAPEEMIQKMRSFLNEHGKRMTKKLQELIHSAAENMPLATKYGYTRAELSSKKL